MAVREVLHALIEKINANPEPIQGLSLNYQFDLSGDDGGTLQIRIADGQVEYAEGTPYEPVCTLQLSDQNFIKLVNDDLNPTTAFMMGKLKVKGDISLALKLHSLFKKYQ
ncbi:SCP2 sterol-binding domain-containing protein [Brevibacillus dissolubilis]|uniref:SCP2 sterol-binding domain-containing protein n=1 Tax=Brevibacillus dissolubilis TaxID=1844116 RepID=UPI001117A538|nr:SCP2 sterol-binding domain-containing protein [Brevibacillus dissolubilis]